MLDINLKSVFYVTQESIKSMIHNKSGCIINISSIWGQTGGSCEVHYSASKAGIIGMTKALAKEVRTIKYKSECNSSWSHIYRYEQILIKRRD